MSREIWSEIMEFSKLYPPHRNEDLFALLESKYTISKKGESIEVRKSIFTNQIGSHKSEYPREMLIEFLNYWSEISPNGKKMRFEKQPVFDVKLRLQRWHKNSKNGTKKGHNISEAKSIADRILSGELS